MPSLASYLFLPTVCQINFGFSSSFIFDDRTIRIIILLFLFFPFLSRVGVSVSQPKKSSLQVVLNIMGKKSKNLAKKKKGQQRSNDAATKIRKDEENAASFAASDTLPSNKHNVPFDGTAPTMLVPREWATDYEMSDAGFDDKEDIPACDACGKEYSGVKMCSRCYSIFYCSEECQHKHWKEGGHKHECSVMKEKTIETGKAIVAQMKDESLHPLVRVSNLERLDLEAAYRVAVKHGLHGAMQELFKLDLDWASDKICKYPPLVCVLTATIFRRFRCEGRCVKFDFNIDGRRIKRYVQSDPSAFDDWFNAIVRILEVYFDPHRLLDEEREEAGAFVLMSYICLFGALCDVTAAKAILLSKTRHKNRNNDEEEVAGAASAERARFILLSLKTYLAKCWNESALQDPDPDPDPDPVGLYDLMQQFEPLLNMQCQQLGIEIDTMDILGIQRNSPDHARREFGVLFARKAIEKGACLTCEEMMSIMKSARPV